MVGIVVSFICGGTFGAVMMCLFVAAGEADKRMENKSKENEK